MAPHLFSFSLAAIVLALGAHAQQLTIVAYVPFQSQVPPISTPPGLAGFKDRFKQAFEGSLQYINDITASGLGKPPSLKLVVPSWVYTEASAQATFPYTEEWLGPIQFLVAAPTTFYYYDNSTNSAGFKLINIYEALPEGTTFDIVVSAPPAIASPPSPPPPIFPRSPRSPRPPSPSDNSTSNLRIASSMYSNSMPLMNDTANFTLFVDTYFDTFAAMMTCATNNINSTAFNSTGPANTTLIAETCSNNRSFANTTRFPTRPSNYTVTQELIVDPLIVVPSSSARRRRQLLDFDTPTAPAGLTWNVTIVAIYFRIPFSTISVYITAQEAVVQGQKVLLVEILVFNQFALVQSASFYFENGAIVPITPEVPGYSVSGPSETGRRLIERRIVSAAQADVANIKWAELEPSDVAYGTDKSVYEVFSVVADYHTAGAACFARGAKLASYSSEGAQIFIDILCDGAAGMQCWVEGNSNGACNAVSSSVVHPLSCVKAMPFVCVKDKKAITTRTASTTTHQPVADLAIKKPSDVAYDTHKNLYELFLTPVDYYTAGSVCIARGAQLANYGSEAAQVFIDVLCEASSGQTCWVEGNQAGRCSAVKASDVHQVSCMMLQPFVCTKMATSKDVGRG